MLGRRGRYAPAARKEELNSNDLHEDIIRELPGTDCLGCTNLSAIAVRIEEDAPWLYKGYAPPVRTGLAAQTIQGRKARAVIRLTIWDELHTFSGPPPTQEPPPVKTWSGRASTLH